MSSGIQIFKREAKLLLLNATEALDLSDLRFHFTVNAADIETPNTAIIRVYNLAAAHASEVIQEYSSVVLTAGYENPGAGQIFKGTVKQFRRGRERNVDSFLDILAADGDMGYNFGILNSSLAAGSSEADRLQTYAKGLGLPTDPNAQSFLNQTGGILPRGKVLFGLARNYMRDLAATNLVRWSIQDGVVTLVPLAGYLPGQIIAINSATGMVGVPEATDQGILVTCLLNPAIKIGQLIQLNNADITQTDIKQQFFPGYTDLNLIATVDSSTDGYYRVIVVEHIGDTRDQPWYTKLVCLSVDRSAPASSSVAPFG